MIGYYYTENIKNKEILRDVVKPSDSNYEEVKKELSECYIFQPSWEEQEDGTLTRVSNNLWAIVVWMRSCGVPVLNENTVDELITRMKIQSRMFPNGDYTEDEIEGMRDVFLKYSGLYTAVGGISRGVFMLELTARLSKDMWGDDLGFPNRAANEWTRRLWFNASPLPKRTLEFLCEENYKLYRTCRLEYGKRYTKEQLSHMWIRGGPTIGLRLEEDQSVYWYQEQDDRYAPKKKDE